MVLIIFIKLSLFTAFDLKLIFCFLDKCIWHELNFLLFFLDDRAFGFDRCCYFSKKVHHKQ